MIINRASKKVIGHLKSARYWSPAICSPLSKARWSWSIRSQRSSRGKLSTEIVRCSLPLGIPSVDDLLRSLKTTNQSTYTSITMPLWIITTRTILVLLLLLHLTLHISIPQTSNRSQSLNKTLS